MNIRKPYLVFLGDVAEPSFAKTGYGVRDWAGDDCIAQLRLSGCKADLGLPDMSPPEAASAGAGSLLIGIAPVGGRVADAWVPPLLQAAEAGLDVVSGLHMRLEDVPGLADAARRHGTGLVNVRTPPRNLPVGNGIKRSGKRLLTVGTDCALGKKYTALSLTRALCAAGADADFRATGQTGILISGAGIPIDCVVADFVAGAAETLSPAADAAHWDVIEGQGSLFHPGYAAVTLGLVHGSQPDALVLCHNPRRTHIIDAEHVKIPPLRVVADRYIEAAQLTNAAVQLVGLSLDTSSFDEDARQRLLDEAAQDLGVPAFDPMKTPADAVVNRILEL